MVLKLIRGDVVSAHRKKLSLGLVTSDDVMLVVDEACVGVAVLDIRPSPIPVYLFVCVCIGQRERERERE